MPFAPGNPVADVSVRFSYNTGAASADAELGLARRVGPVWLLGAARTFGNAFGAGERRSAVGGGVNVRPARYLAVAGDASTLLARRAGGFDSGNVAPGARWADTFDRPGVYAYHRTPHPFMKGTVRVR